MPVRGFHHHFPVDGGMVEHSGPAEACDDSGLGPLTDGIPEARSTPAEALDEAFERGRSKGYWQGVHDGQHTSCAEGLARALRDAYEGADR